MNLASDHSTARTTAALLGSLPFALAASVALARLLPVAVELRFTIGFFGFFAIWPAAICALLVARSGARAWGYAVASTVAAVALAQIGG